MPEEFYRTRNYKVDHSTFGGELTDFDFNGHHTIASMASKIAQDFKFDEYCRKNEQARVRSRKHPCRHDREVSDE